MKVPFGQLLRGAWRPALGALALGSFLVGCDDATDPTAVTLDELKYAFGLKIYDQGNGTVRLKWTGVNNEEDFSGYNIYGVKDSAETIAKEGLAIKLLKDDGEPDADGKSALGKMGYNGTDWESAGPSTNPDGDFAVYPFYTTKNGEDAVLPSCFPATSDDGAECKPVAAEGNKGTFNGRTWIDMKGLSIGSTYCFTVLATLDSGKKAAPTTSEVRCVTPRAKVSASALSTTPSATNKKPVLDFEALRKACGTKGGDACGTFKVTETAKPTSDCAVTEPVCFDYISSTVHFTANGQSGIQDLGYYSDGFAATNLPKIPALKGYNALQNKDGYSLAGQSLPIEANHVYAVAHGTAATPTSFYYHLVYVSKVDHAAGTADIEVRVSNKADDR